MLARHKLIEAMIRNNELQLKNESARGGAEIERECARRDAAVSGRRPGGSDKAVDGISTLGSGSLEEEQRRLVSEREWLNAVVARVRERTIGTATDGTRMMSTGRGRCGSVECDPSPIH